MSRGKHGFRRPPHIRAARPEDAPAIAAMANALNRAEGKAPDLFTPELVLREGFEPDAAFTVLIADRDGEVVGYASFVPGYDSDLAARALFLIDLFVVEPARGQGVGRALLAAVAAEAVDRGARSLEWGVRSANTKAREFYRRLGARDEDVRILDLDGPALRALAIEARRG